MLLLPPSPGTCPICAVDHEHEMPHNKQSLYYQFRFYEKAGRWPTWADAVAHCAQPMQEYWRRELEKIGKWSEPEDGEPIADPPAESIRQIVGEPDGPGFGPSKED